MAATVVVDVSAVVTVIILIPAFPSMTPPPQTRQIRAVIEYEVSLIQKHPVDTFS